MQKESKKMRVRELARWKTQKGGLGIKANKMNYMMT